MSLSLYICLSSGSTVGKATARLSVCPQRANNPAILLNTRNARFLLKMFSIPLVIPNLDPLGLLNAETSLLVCPITFADEYVFEFTNKYTVK